MPACIPSHFKSNVVICSPFPLTEIQHFYLQAPQAHSEIYFSASAIYSTCKQQGSNKGSQKLRRNTDTVSPYQENQPLTSHSIMAL